MSEDILHGLRSTEPMTGKENSGLAPKPWQMSTDTSSGDIASNSSHPEFFSRFVFYHLDPSKIPKSKFRKASTKSGARMLGRKVMYCRESRKLQYVSVNAAGSTRFTNESFSLHVDLLVTGVTAVSKNGVRLGKGMGYAEREFEILREAGVAGRSPDTLVATTCHTMQLLDHLDYNEYMDASHDLGADLIATSDSKVHRVKRP
eukprot:gnl/TRDRNA2_/TRDRNA2_83267_c0_seq1.p2 gnl/TRDRNA2_/TRDRNA2_83267_c0~~gnl/TRDRNA2_/TRDRNA2_83267_c0_seq1.p2  ORF type:complete len:203 (-),score=23.65 gnl/TRDRNA2_/TRDRNA2_83267_c0_seq1:398-1006(-)